MEMGKSGVLVRDGEAHPAFVYGESVTPGELVVMYFSWDGLGPTAQIRVLDHVSPDEFAEGAQLMPTAQRVNTWQTAPVAQPPIPGLDLNDRQMDALARRMVALMRNSEPAGTPQPVTDVPPPMPSLGSPPQPATVTGEPAPAEGPVPLTKAEMFARQEPPVSASPPTPASPELMPTAASPDTNPNSAQQPAGIPLPAPTTGTNRPDDQGPGIANTAPISDTNETARLQF